MTEYWLTGHQGPDLIVLTDTIMVVVCFMQEAMEVITIHSEIRVLRQGVMWWMNCLSLFNLTSRSSGRVNIVVEVNMDYLMNW
jgi:hypothetical protein